MFKRLLVKRPKKKEEILRLRISKLRKGRWKKLFRLKNLLNILEKRERFGLQTIILTAGVLITQIIWQDIRFFMVLMLAVVSYMLTWWSLKEDIEGNEKILLFILPVAFTASLSLFYFLLPSRWIIRLTTTGIFAIGTYAILLVENIYNVASQRSIQLLRAAQSVGLLVTLTIIFFSVNIIYSLRLPFYVNMALISFVCFIMAIQSLWSVNLDKNLSRELIFLSVIVGLGAGELSLALSFWPVENSSFSLLIAATFYSLVGVIQQYLAERLFINVIREYIIVFIFTFILTFLTTKWG